MLTLTDRIHLALWGRVAGLLFHPRLCCAFSEVRSRPQPLRHAPQAFTESNLWDALHIFLAGVSCTCEGFQKMADRRISPSSPTFGSLCRATACSLCLVWSGLWLTAGCFLGWWYQTPANRNPLTSGVQAGETLTRMFHNTVCLYPGCSWCSWNTLSCFKCFGLTHTHTYNFSFPFLLDSDLTVACLLCFTLPF